MIWADGEKVEPMTEPSPDEDLAAGRTVRFDTIEEMDAALDAAAEEFREERGHDA